MLAIGLGLGLLGAMIAFTWNLLDRRAALARGARDVQAGTALIEQIENDLLAGLVGDAGVGAGVKGTATTLRLLTRGVWLGDAAGTATSGDLHGTEYAFDGAGRLSAHRWVQGLDGGGGGGSFDVISDRVQRLRLRYFDGREWRDSFDSLETGGLPVAIEVAMWFTALRNEVATGLPVAAAATGDDEGDVAASDSSEAGPPLGPPHRLRVIIVPDGPLTAWRDRS
jgi:hypothetical protein